MLFLSLLFSTAVGAPGTVVLPFLDGGAGETATKQAQSAFLAAARESALPAFRAPKDAEKELGLDPRPSVAACKDDLVCLSQVGAALKASQVIIARVVKKGSDLAEFQVVAVASASLVRDVTVVLGSDGKSAQRAFREGVYRVFGVIGEGEISLLGVPAEGLTNIDGTVKVERRFVVKPGYHEIKVEAAGYEPFTKELFVKPNERVEVRVALESAPAPEVAAVPALQPVAAEPALVAPPKATAPALAAPQKAAIAKATPSPKKSPASAPAAPRAAAPAHASTVSTPSPPPRASETSPASPAPAPKVKELVAAPARVQLAKQAAAKPVATPANWSPFRLPWIVGASFTGAALIGSVTSSALFSASSSAAQHEPIQVRAADRVREAGIEADAANGFGIATAVLGAATATLVVLDLTYHRSSSVSVGVAPGSVSLAGAF
jgi:hypothetical protein